MLAEVGVAPWRDRGPVPHQRDRAAGRGRAGRARAPARRGRRSRDFYDRPEVRDVIAMLRVLRDPDDQVAAFRRAHASARVHRDALIA